MRASDRMWLLLGAGVLAVLATGCGHENGSKPPSHTHVHAPAVTGASEKAPPLKRARGGAFGYYAFTYRGVSGTVLIPALPRDDARVAEIDAYRSRAGIPTLGYTVVDLDNTRGKSMIAVSDVTVLPVKGPNWEGDTRPDDVLKLWKAPTNVVHRYARQSNGVAVGHRRSFVLIGEFPLTEKPREVLVTVAAGREHVLRAGLVRVTHPYAEGGLAASGK